MTTQKFVCPGCHGVVTGTRKTPLDVSIEHHRKTCPNRGITKETAT